MKARDNSDRLSAIIGFDDYRIFGLKNPCGIKTASKVHGFARWADSLRCFQHRTPSQRSKTDSGPHAKDGAEEVCPIKSYGSVHRF